MKCSADKRREARVEAFDDHAVDARVRERVELVAQVRDARGRRREFGGRASLGERAGVEELARMRLEGHHAGRQVEPVRGRPHALDERAMPAMHAIEVADGERARRATGRVGQSAEDPHEETGGR